MNLKTILLIIVALTVSASVNAQELKSENKTDEQQQAVTNDDQGRAFVITGSSLPLDALNNHGKDVITEPQQYSIFLGADWSKPSVRARESRLSNLLANLTDSQSLNALDRVGIKNVFGATQSQEQLDAFSGDRNVSDLEIQGVLAAMIEDGRLAQPSASTVYVVFLDGKLHSTLGSLRGGKHYAAYHNIFNASGVTVHYAVVPFQQDLATSRALAERAFLAAVLNPTGSVQ
jgi:hypothetical protein